MKTLTLNYLQFGENEKKKEEGNKFVIDYTGSDVYKDINLRFLSSILKLQLNTEKEILESDWELNLRLYL